MWNTIIGLVLLASVFFIAFEPINGYADSNVIVNHTASLTNGTDGFIIDQPFDVETVVIDGDTFALVIGAGSNNVSIINMTDPTSPVTIANATQGEDGFSRLGAPHGIDILDIGNNTFAIITSFAFNGVQIMNITDPLLPTATSIAANSGSFKLNNPWDVAAEIIDGTPYAFVTSNTANAVQIIDLSTPATPIATANVTDGIDGFDALEAPRGINLFTIGTNNYAIVAATEENGVQIINVTNPSIPTPVSSMFQGVDFTHLNAPRNIVTTVIDSNTYALVTASTSDSVQIIDVTNVTSPVATAKFDITDGSSAMDGAIGIRIADVGTQKYAFVAGSLGDGIQFIDISTPSVPRDAGSIFDDTDGFTNLNGVEQLDFVSINSQEYIITAGLIDDGIDIASIDNLFLLDLTESIGLLDVLDTIADLTISLSDSLGITDLLTATGPPPPEPDPEPTPEPTPAPAQTKSKSSGGSGRTGVSMSEMYEKTGRSTFDKVKEWVSSDEYFKIGIKNLIVRGSLDTTKQIPSSAPAWFYDTGLAWKNGQITDKEYLDAAQYLIDHDIMK